MQQQKFTFSHKSLCSDSISSEDNKNWCVHSWRKRLSWVMLVSVIFVLLFSFLSNSNHGQTTFNNSFKTSNKRNNLHWFKSTQFQIDWRRKFLTWLNLKCQVQKLCQEETSHPRNIFENLAQTDGFFFTFLTDLRNLKTNSSEQNIFSHGNCNLPDQ